MKKLMVLILVLSMAASAFAENGLTVGGDVRTGLNISKVGDADPTATVKNSDDAGTPGRFRLSFNYTKDNIQVKWRTQMNGNTFGLGKFEGTDMAAESKGWYQTTADNIFAYAYAMGDFFDNQFRVSAWKIDNDQPWETSGDEIWDSVETFSGVRFEFKPTAVAGLNLGLLMPALSKSVEVGDYFSELGFAARYENDAFDARFGIRLDSEADPGLIPSDAPGAKVVWRLNAKAISGVVPGLSLWFNGKITGIKTHDGVPDDAVSTVSWMYVKFAQDKLTGAALRLGLETVGKDVATNKLTAFYVKPVFSYKLTDWAEATLTIQANLNLAYKDNYKVATKDPSMFDKLTVEPSVIFSIPGGFVIRPVYTLGFNAENGPSSGGKARTDHTFELRFQYGF